MTKRKEKSKKERRTHEYYDGNKGCVVIWVTKKEQKRRKRKGKYNEYIDGNIGWVVIWVTGVMECARCSRALLPLRPLSQRVSKKGKKAILRKSHEKY